MKIGSSRTPAVMNQCETCGALWRYIPKIMFEESTALDGSKHLRCKDHRACAGRLASKAKQPQTTCMSDPTNPPIPAGLQLLQQSQVTQAITDWAVNVLDNTTYQPMFSISGTTQPILGPCIAHVEWHPPEEGINYWHRGVTVYQVRGSLSLSDFESFLNTNGQYGETR